VHGFAVRHRKGLRWSILGLGLLVLVVWSNPTTLVALVVVLIALVLVGLMGLYAGHQSPGSASDPPAAIGSGVGSPTDSADD
jgi:hypothetical protein